MISPTGEPIVSYVAADRKITENTRLSAGWVFGLTLTDTSSYVARILFMDEISQENRSNALLIAHSFPEPFEERTPRIDEYLRDMGYSVQTYVGRHDIDPQNFRDSDLIAFFDHGAPFTVVHGVRLLQHTPQIEVTRGDHGCMPDFGCLQRRNFNHRS